MYTKGNLVSYPGFYLEERRSGTHNYGIGIHTVRETLGRGLAVVHRRMKTTPKSSPMGLEIHRLDISVGSKRR